LAGGINHVVVAEELSRAADLLPRLGALRMPILARVGELDAACPPAKTHAIARVATQTAVQIVPGAGHTLLLEDARSRT
jgi:pimeloyl-ACP methyl ester carboxylesterase